MSTTSTPRGGRGFGAFNQAGGGGQGGESCYSNSGEDMRRGAGGGGGRFGPDYYYEFDGDDEPKTPVRCQELIGLDAEHGGGGGIADGLGAESQTERARGGFIGEGPFVDGDESNNFFGTLLTFDASSGAPLQIEGELDRLYAGAGGGAGGDAIRSATFPLDRFYPLHYQKGEGGGGGAGGILINAIGEIVLHPEASVTANGGQGGGGENKFGINRVGGGSGAEELDPMVPRPGLEFFRLPIKFGHDSAL